MYIYLFIYLFIRKHFKLGHTFVKTLAYYLALPLLPKWQVEAWAAYAMNNVINLYVVAK